MTTGSAADRTGSSDFDLLERQIVDHQFELQPGFAVFLGLHDYDGRVPDLSRTATDAWVAKARALLTRLAAVPIGSLDASRRLDRKLLQLLLEGSVFDLTESRDLDRNPMAYIGQVSLTS